MNEFTAAIFFLVITLLLFGGGVMLAVNLSMRKLREQNWKHYQSYKAAMDDELSKVRETGDFREGIKNVEAINKAYKL